MNHVSSTLTVCRTPLQVFNAQEARERFHAQDQNHLLLVYRKAVDLNQMRSVQDNKWRSTTVIRLTALSRTLYPQILRTRLPTQVDFFYTGLTSNLHAHLANLYQKDAEIRIIDDGNETLLLVDNLRQGKHQAFSPSLGDRLLGRRTSQHYLDRALFFSQYDLPLPSGRVIHNDYRSFKSKVSQLKQTEETVFIGSNLVGNYIRNEEAFDDLIRSLRQRLTGPLTYILHRYESMEKLGPILKSHNITPIKLDTIVENYFHREGFIPKNVATFRSTAADTLSSLYSVKSIFYTIPQNLIISDEKRNELNNLYRYYENNKNNVVILK